MAVTDGTAKFEKRKFADNEKLSMPANQRIDISVPSQFVPDAINDFFSDFVVPADGWMCFNMVGITSGHKDDNYFIAYQMGHIINARCMGGTLSGNRMIFPVVKGFSLRILTKYISGFSEIFFQPAESES